MGIWEWLMGTPGGLRTTGKNNRFKRAKGPLSLQPGDIVSYEETDYQVEKVFAYSAAGFAWFDYLLFDAAKDERIWLSAEDDDGLELAIYRSLDWEVPDRIGKSITYEGRFFRLLEHGEADTRIEGDAQADKQTRVEYWDFSTSDEKSLLGIERWGGEIEASLGTPIKEYELKIYPRGEHA